MSAVKVMPIGDSITYGVGGSSPGGYRTSLWNQLSSAGFEVDFVGSKQDDPAGAGDPDHEGNPSIPIDNVNGFSVAALAETWLTAQQPDVILLMIGTNDAIALTPGATIAKNLGRLIDHITEISPNAVLMVSSLPPSTRGDINAIIDDYNAAIPQIVAERQQQGKQVSFIDAGGAIGLSNLDDNVHPNDVGYSIIADAWYGAVSDLLVPTVTIAPLDGQGSETGTDEATFVVSRSGLTNDALTVSYSVSGSAASGTDYQALSGTVVIPAGTNSVTVSVSPLLDSVSSEGPESVTLTLSSQSTYEIDSVNSNATIEIVEDAAPTAMAAISNFMPDGSSTYSFIITYSDNLAIDAASLDNNDIRVIGPNGFNQLATLVETNGTAASTEVTYRITAPGGFWDAADLGTYEVFIESGQVVDNNNNFLPDGKLSEFEISLDTVRIEAEDFIGGVQGVNYNDTTNANQGRAPYRYGGVDIGATTDAGGGFNVGYITAGEWLTYDIEVPATGTYSLVARVASGENSQHTLQAQIEGQSTTASFAGTGGWQSWEDASGNTTLNLSAGQHQLRLDMLSSSFNLNYVELMAV